jgi:hypothetical protein
VIDGEWLFVENVEPRTRDGALSEGARGALAAVKKTNTTFRASYEEATPPSQVIIAVTGRRGLSLC